MNKKTYINQLKEKLVGVTRYKDGKLWRSILNPSDYITDAQYEAIVYELRSYGVYL